MPRMQQSPKVSGPGKLSKRTDLPGNGTYGSRKEINEIKSGAPMPRKTPPEMYRLPSAQSIVPLTQETQYPDQPITDGLSVGPGYTPAPAVNNRYAMISKYMDQLDTLAAQPDAPSAFKVFLNFVKTEATKE
jgi:hypothetical protein